jgi:hypothetical protein
MDAGGGTAAEPPVASVNSWESYTLRLSISISIRSATCLKGGIDAWPARRVEIKESAHFKQRYFFSGHQLKEKVIKASTRLALSLFDIASRPY